MRYISMFVNPVRNFAVNFYLEIIFKLYAEEFIFLTG